MQQGGATDLVGRLSTQCFVLEIAGTGRVRVDDNVKAANQRFARRRRQTHVRVEPHDENRLNASPAEPVLESCIGKRPVDVLLKERFGSESSLWSQARR